MAAETESAKTGVNAAVASTGAKLVRPDKKALDDRIKSIEAQIAEKKKLTEDVKKKFDDLKSSSSSGKTQSETEQKEYKKLLEHSQKLKAEREAAKAAVENARKSSKVLREKYETMQRDLKELECSSLESVDERIRQKDYYMSTNSLSLKEEKAIHAEIKALQGSRKIFGELDALRQRRDAEFANIKTLNEKFEAAKAAYDKAHKAEQEQWEKCKSSQPVRVEKTEIQGWKDSANKARAEINDLYNEIKTARTEFKQKEDAYFKWYNEKKKEEQAKRKEEIEKRKEEEKLRKLQKEQEEEESIHADSFATIDQLTKYLSKFVSSDEKPVEEVKEEVKQIEGMTLIGKNARTAVDDFLGTKVDKSKKPPAPKAAKKPVFRHDLKLIQEFESLKITAPLTEEEIPPALEALKAKKVELENDKVARRAAREARIAEMLAKESEEKEKESSETKEPEAAAGEGEKKEKRKGKGKKEKVEEEKKVEEGEQKEEGSEETA